MGELRILLNVSGVLREGLSVKGAFGESLADLEVGCGSCLVIRPMPSR